MANNLIHVKLNNDAPQRNLFGDPKANRILVELRENQKDENVIVVRQRPSQIRKKRTGLRPFAPALIAKIAKEGKQLAKDHGRRETSRILIERYPLANLSLTSVDR